MAYSHHYFASVSKVLIFLSYDYLNLHDKIANSHIIDERKKLSTHLIKADEIIANYNPLKLSLWTETFLFYTHLYKHGFVDQIATL